MKILLVDDDPSVLQTLLAFLKQMPGHETLIGTSGPLALENAETAGGVDLLITDVVMEPMDGFTLRQELQSRYPEMKVIFISGYDLSEYGPYTEGCEVLMKPIGSETLLEAVSRVELALPPAAGQPKATPVATAQPTATPVAQPTATPVAAQPKATPVATAQPTATPVAQPTATPVAAQPKATPVATAQPTATPVAQPTATPVAAQPKATPVATAQPTATPAAQPTATPVAAQPKATPVATAQPTATPAAQPTATPVAAQPKATPVATAQPTATPVVQPTATPVAAVPQEVFDSEDLAEKRLGNYNVVWRIGEGKWGPVYVAVQTSMARPVAMKVLSERLRDGDPTARQRFIATAQAKASIKHPSILAVYEADSANGHTYYTYEYADGVHLADAKKEGRQINDQLVLRILKVVADGMAYLHAQKIIHAPLSPTQVYLTKENNPRLANIATLERTEQPEIQDDLSVLYKAVSDLLPFGVTKDEGLQALLNRMAAGGADGFKTWAVFLMAVKALEPKVIPADAIKLTAQEEAAIRAVEEAKRQQKRSIIMTTVGLFTLLWIIGGIIYVKFIRSNERNHDIMLRIPAGEFVYQDGEKRTTNEFWIDQYEVTIGQYARFLAYLEANPTTEFDHPDQPKGKSHIPARNAAQWKIYYERARAGLPAGNVPIDLNCPVFMVDFWDAYAYAKWAGKRLPTETEWEKAARGTNGFKYPWGNNADPKKFNGGQDYVAEPHKGIDGTVDGYTWWNPVDDIKTDVSPFGVIGMAGNVSEWVTGEDHKPMIRGGSFHFKKDNPLTNRATAETGIIPELRLEFVGFRCVSDRPPAN